MSSAKKKDSNPDIMAVLTSMFGGILHRDIIQSVALNCNWKLNDAVNILYDLSGSVNKEHIKPAKKKLNTVSYDENADADVVIEGWSTQSYSKAAGNKQKKVAQAKPVQKIEPAKHPRELEYERIVNHINTGCKVLVLMRGLPGSGKSHLAKQIISNTVKSDYRIYVFSTDDYFTQGNSYNYNPLALSQAHDWNQRRAHDAMKSGMSPVIIDNTNTQMWEMKTYVIYASNYGYAVEVLEPFTPWSFKVAELAKKNIHKVPQLKLGEMLDRYERNVTPQKLFALYQLRYKPNNYPPQPRTYPPFHANQPSRLKIEAPKFSHSKNGNNNKDGSGKNGIVATKDAERKKKVRKRKVQSANANSNVSITTGDNPNRSESDDESVDLMQETDVQTTDLDDFKYPEMQQDLLTGDCTEYILIMPDKSLVYQKEHDDGKKDDEEPLINLTEEVASTSTSVEREEESSTSLLVDISENAQGEAAKSVGDLVWGEADDNCLISWEVVGEASKAPDPQPQREPFRKSEVATNTCSLDFALLNQDVDENASARIITAQNRNIANEYDAFVSPRCPPPRLLMLDKGTMTGKENILVRSRCGNEEQHFRELVNLFPHLSVEDLKDVFDKCHGDVNWAVDLLLESDKMEPTPVAGSALGQQRNEQVHVHSDECNCVSGIESIDSSTAAECASASASDERLAAESDVRCAKRSADKTKRVLSEEDKQLIQQINEGFSINEEHYSEKLQAFRRKMHGEPEHGEAAGAAASNAEDEPSRTTDTESEDSEEDVIEMNFGMNFIEQLERNFGNPDPKYLKGFQPVMNLPASLVKQLHAYWVQSVITQLESQSGLTEAMLREDEELARKIQEQESAQPERPRTPDLQEIMDMEIAMAVYRQDQQEWKKETPDDLASKMKRQKLFETFPNMDQDTLLQILQAMDNSLEQTIEVLVQNGQTKSNIEETKQRELIEKAKKEYMKLKQGKAGPLHAADDIDANMTHEEAAKYYRELAAHHLANRQQCYNKAQDAFKKRQTQVAEYYSAVAQLHKKKYEHANERAASAFLSAHSLVHNNVKTLDLHGLYVKEAEEALALFLDNHISNLLESNQKTKETLFIITGRGKNSWDKQSHIKPVVKQRLKLRKVSYEEMNPGLLKVSIRKHSIMTKDIKK